MNKLPNGWQIKTLKSFGIFIRGVSYKKGQLLKEKSLNSVFLLRANNIQEKLDLTDLQILPKELAEGKIIQNNDILFAMSSGSKHIVGKNIILKDLQDYSFGAFCGLFRTTSKKLNPNFLDYFLKSDIYKEYIISCSRGTNINNLRFSDLENLLIPVPPLEVQKEIASRLDFSFDKIDRALKLLNQNKEYIKKYRLSLLKYAFDGKLTPSSKNWEIKTLGEVCEITMGQSPNGKSLININENKNSNTMEFHQGKIYFSNKYILQSNIVTTDIKKIAKKNSVLLCVRAPVGIINITQREIAIGRGLCALNLKSSNNEFLYFYLLTKYNYFNEKSTGSTFGAITLDIIKKTKIPVPPLEVQKEIVSILDNEFEVMEKVEKLNNENIENLLLLKKSLLKEAFSGNLLMSKWVSEEFTP